MVPVKPIEYTVSRMRVNNVYAICSRDDAVLENTAQHWDRKYKDYVYGGC